MEELLKELLKVNSKIEKNTRSKWSTDITVTDNKTDFNNRFDPPLELDRDKNYEIALVNLDTFYSFPNIDKDNNLFEYSKDNGKTWLKIFIPEGAYEIKALNTKIQELIGDIEKPPITIKPNNNTLKSILIIKENYKVSFKRKNTLAGLLGFNPKDYGAGTYESENIINILSINSILIHLNIIAGSIVNGQTYPVIYSFFPDVSPGYKIIEKPTYPRYLPVSNKTIKDFKILITDQNNNPLNLRGEIVTITFNLREI